MRTHIPKVISTGRLSSGSRTFFDNRPDAPVSEIDKWLVVIDVGAGLIAVEIAFDPSRQIDIPWFPPFPVVSSPLGTRRR
jgi:hypothetical protein